MHINHMCDSTHTDDEDSDDDEPPPVATGKDLEYMTRAVEVAKMSGDPHTKVRSYTHAFTIKRAEDCIHQTILSRT